MNSSSSGLWGYGLSIVETPGLCVDLQLAPLRRACEFQLYALFFTLPFEYYFRGQERTLFTSLKLQLLLFTSTWLCMKSSEVLRFGRVVWSELGRSLSNRILLAAVMFVLVQALAAILAPEFRGNAAKAAVKAGLGVLLAIAAADLAPGSKMRSADRRDPVRNSVIAISVSGACTALLGFGALAGIDAFEHIVHLFQRSEYFLGKRIRFLSTMEYPNTAGSFLSAALCASLALAVFSRPGSHRRWRVAWLGLAAVQGLALASTLSRGAVGATMVAILTATWLLRDKIGRSYRRTALATCFVAILGGVSGLYFAHRATEGEGTPMRKRLARYGLEAGEEIKYLLPNHAYRETIGVENASSFQWRGGTYGVAYRWHSLSADETWPLNPGADFPAAVAPEQNVWLPVSLITPSQEGEYLLIWFVVYHDGETRELPDSYAPGILCVIDPAGSNSVNGLSEKARRYLDAIREERRNLSGIVPPRRSELWPAAFRMFAQRPLLGMGPDNFRLLKSRYMDIPMKDEKILANNLYLETLSGSGILGLASFLWLLWQFGRTLAAKVAAAASPSGWSASYFGVAYLAAFALHGLVDYFLKFTPTYLLFWLLLGILCARGRESQETYANRL